MQNGKKFSFMPNRAKELVDEGIPKEEALKMARDYMETMKSIVDDYSRQIAINGK